ncbi:MAG TPA: hypothetical protein VLF71_03835 [Candidatus Saccharimonadales bacterium]|nr:hypothetical protein [Candidatus Saccharimonadales bacterium]
MIKTHSDDPDVEAAAHQAGEIVERTLQKLPKAQSFDYGGHLLRVGEYGVCTRCTSSIAEAQQACVALTERFEQEQDPVVKEHLQLAAELFRLEAKAAELRAELHNGQGSEVILNTILGFLYNRGVPDAYGHSHHSGGAQ